MSSSPSPSYHLCPDFSIAPPKRQLAGPQGHLDLGTIILSLDVAGVSFPLNFGSLIPIPRDRIFPKGDGDGEDEWDVKAGFTRSMEQLRKAETSIWAKITIGIGGKLGWFRERSEDETLTIEKVLTRYFVPDETYLQQALEVPVVEDFIVTQEKKSPLYMITGLKVAVGARLSKARSRATRPSGDAGCENPETTTGLGGTASYTSRDTENVGFEESSDFVLGLRVRKIYWQEGVRKHTDNVVGATLEDHVSLHQSDVMEGIAFVDNFVGDGTGTNDKVFVHDEGEGSIERSLWVLP